MNVINSVYKPINRDIATKYYLYLLYFTLVSSLDFYIYEKKFKQ